jgi:hypothetical protein
MSFRQPEIQVPNALAQYAQLQQIQGGQQAQELNKLQIQEYQRAREEEEGTRNFLRGRDLSAPDTITGLTQFGKTGLGIAKSLQEQNAAALTAKNTQSQIDERNFGLQDKKLKFAWNAVGSASTPQAAIAELTKGVKDGVFNMQSVTPEIQQLQNMTPEQYQQYRVQKVMGILEAKDKLGFMLPNNVRQDAGGTILTIQNNPMLPGYGQPIAGAAITKTPTIGERTAQGQLNLAQQKFDFEKANPGFELQQTEDGSFVGINKRTLQATPVTMGGAVPLAPAAAPAAPGAGMPGPRIPAAAPQVIPGMTSVLDQPAPVAPVAPGSPVKGAPKSKDISVSEQQASYNISRVLNAADEIGKITKKDPKALAPGGMEAALKSTGLEGAANLARSTNRQIVNGAQRDALDALLYLATGAAYNKEQLQGAFEAYIPSYTDDTGNREAKQARMTSLIQDAKIRAGKAWTPKMDAAMTSLTGSTKPAAAANIPAPKGVDSSLWNVMTPEERKLWQPK